MPKQHMKKQEVSFQIKISSQIILANSAAQLLVDPGDLIIKPNDIRYLCLCVLCGNFYIFRHCKISISSQNK